MRPLPPARLLFALHVEPKSSPAPRRPSCWPGARCTADADGPHYDGPRAFAAIERLLRAAGRTPASAGAPSLSRAGRAGTLEGKLTVAVRASFSTAHLAIDARDEAIEPDTNRGERAGGDDGREGRSPSARQRGLDGGREQPHLNEHQDRDQRVRPVDGGQSPPVGIAGGLHGSSPGAGSNPSAISVAPSRSSRIRGSGRGGGPCRTAPVSAEK